MKRIAVFCLLFSIFLVSCHKENATPLSMLEQVLQTHSNLPKGSVTYHSAALAGQQAYMTKRLRSLLYDEGSDRSIPEFEKVVEYAVNISDGQYGMEIHIYRMRSEEDARNMEKLLNRRVTLLKRRSLYLYAPTVYENYFSSAKVYTKGEFVFLLSTGLNDVIAEQLRDMI